MFNPTTEKIDPDPYQGLSLSLRTAQKEVANPLKLTAVFLDAADIDAFLEIQNKVRPVLKQDYHLKERTKEDLERHFNAGMPIVGIKTQTGQLVAQCLIAFPKNEAVKNLDGYPISEQEKAHTAVVQSLCVDPDFQGMKLSRILLEKARDVAVQEKCTQLVSAIADDNEDSIRTFDKGGYKPFHSGPDPVRGYDKTYFRKSVFRCDAT